MLDQKTLEQLERSSRPKQDSCDTPAHWLLLEFPLLCTEGFAASLSCIADTIDDDKSSALSDEEFFNLCLEKAIEIAREQMEALLDMASSDGDSASEGAHGADLSIASADLKTIAQKAIGTMLFTDCAYQPKQVREYCLSRAADAMRFLSTEGLADYLIDCLDISLSSNLQLSEKIRMNLLRALLQNADYYSRELPSHFSFFRTARILHDALLLEIQRNQFDQKLKYYQAIMDSMVSYPYHLAPATLQAIALTSPGRSLREMAAAAAHAVAESLETRWNDTVADRLSDLESRRRKLAELCRMQGSNERAVQVIFNSLKGSPLADLDDPRLPAIRTLLRYENEMRMASCWSVFGQGQYIESVDRFLTGLEILVTLAVNSGSAGYSHDSLKLLNLVKKKNPDLRDLIAKLVEEDSMLFVAKSMQSEPNSGDTDISVVPLVDARD